METLLCHGGVSLGMDVLCFDGGDVASVSRDGTVFAIGRVLSVVSDTLL